MSKQPALEQTLNFMLSCCPQDKLLLEQEGLRDQLKQALELHLHPKTSVDTATIADKVVSMFDDILQARKMIQLASVAAQGALRHCLPHSSDHVMTLQAGQNC